MHLDVNLDARIFVAHRDGVAWLRVEGKGTFQNSSPVRDYAVSRLDAGDASLVIDLEACDYMDSTFMGTLTAIGCRMLGRSRQALEVVNAAERAYALLENLGLNEILSVRRDVGQWAAFKKSIARKLVCVEDTSGRQDKAELMLDAHQTLADTSRENAARFGGVVDLLKQELQEARP